MTEAEWRVCTNAEEMIAFSGGRASLRKLRLFACSCARQVQYLVLDVVPAQRAIETAERYADGLASDKEREAAYSRAYDAHARACLDTFEARTRSANQRLSAMFMASLTAFHDMTNVGRSAIYAALALTGERAAHVVNVEHYRELCAKDRAPAAHAVRDIFGNPFCPLTFAVEWRTSTALAIAQQMYESRDFGAMPILADALQDAGCDNEDILSHCRSDGPHVRGCWVVDLVLGKS